MRTVLYVVEQYPELTQTFVVEEVRHLVARGVDVTVAPVRPTRTAGAPVPGVPVVPVPMRRPGVVETLRVVLAALRRSPGPALRAVRAAVAGWIPHRQMDLYQALAVLAVLDVVPDRVHAHFAMRGASVGSLVAAGLRVPFSFTAHAYDIFEYRRDTERLHAVADVQVAVCEYNAAYQRRHWPAVADPVVVPCGVDVGRFALRDPAAADRHHVVTVARLVEKKGLPDLVEAVRLARAEGVDVRCTIIGEGPLRPELERQVAAAGLADVVALPGALPHDAVADALRDAGVFVLPCVVAASGDRDSQPVVVKEAMARGVPCVVTDEVGLPEVVTPDCGRVVPPHAPAALADAIADVVGLSEQDYHQLSLAARARAEAFAFDVTIPRLADVLGLTVGRDA